MDESFRRVTIYQTKKAETLQFIAGCDVVLASYSEVINSCPLPNKVELWTLKKEGSRRYSTGELKDDDCNFVEQWIEEELQHKCGNLHLVDWYRIVIDEAHKIKSHTLPLSYAVNALKGKHRWVLTGTPIMNRPDELYGYFRFLKEPEAKSFKMFKANFTNIHKKKENLERLDAVLARLMIDRTMQDEFLGGPLLGLRPPHQQDTILEFSSEEDILYKAMESKCVKVINDELNAEEGKAKTNGCAAAQDGNEGRVLPKPEKISRKPGYMLVGLNYLRQMTAHPLLAERHIQEMFDVPELRAIYQKLLHLRNPGNLLSARIGVLLQQKEDMIEEHDNAEVDGQSCSLCYDIAIDDCCIPGCQHNFCKICIEDYAKVQVESAGEVDSRCPVCGLRFEVKSLKYASPLKKLRRKPGRPLSKSKKTSARSRSQLPGEDSVGNLPPLIRMPWLDEFDAGRAEMTPSTKLTALEAEITACMNEFPLDKHIVFTQWRAFTCILGRVLQRKKIKFIYLTGDMLTPQRQKTISRFSSDDSTKIVVATLRTAGEGLNLESANRVASIDAWWNCCAERQAFGRVYRIGQKKETYFTRLIIKDTVDERIIKLQEKKLETIELMMKPNASRYEMAQLFGKVRRDKDGRIRIKTADGKKAEELDSDDSDYDEEVDEPDELTDEWNSDSEYDSGLEDGFFD